MTADNPLHRHAFSPRVKKNYDDMTMPCDGVKNGSNGVRGLLTASEPVRNPYGEKKFILIPDPLHRTILVKVLAILLSVACLSNAQPRDTGPLGIVTTFDLPFTPALATSMRYNADPYPDLLVYEKESQRLAVTVNDGEGKFLGWKTIGQTADASYLAVKDINGDGRDDIIVVHRAASQVEVRLTTAIDTLYTTRSYAVNFYPEKVIFGDIDNDNIPDILCFGKLSSGISVLLGKGGGEFKEKTLILPEISVEDASIVKLNEDDYPDLVIHNWLTNEMVFYFGMGDLQFSEQNVVSFGQDTVAVVLGDFNRDRVLDYAIASTATKTLRFFSGDGMASYFLYQSLDWNHQPGEIFSSPLSSRGANDVISVNGKEGTFSVFTNHGDGTFYDEAVFGSTVNLAGIVVADLDNDGWNEVITVSSKEKTVTCYWNARKRISTQKEVAAGTREISFAVGKRPQGLVVADFNDDGFDDVAVANNGSSSLSVLYNSPSYYMTGQIGVPTVESPSTVRMYSKSDSSLTFLLGHESVGKVSVLTLQQRKRAMTLKNEATYTYAIATAENPTVFLPDATLQNQAIEFYVYSNAKQRPLSYFRQVIGAKFVERNFRPIIPSRILAASVADFSGDGKPDLAYVYFDADSVRYGLGITFSDSAGQYQGKTLSSIVPDTSMKKCYLAFDDLNGDNTLDCILYSTPANAIRLALGKGAGRFGDFATVVGNVVATRPDHIQAVDFDGDGVVDLMVLDDVTSELSFYKGRGNGKFFPASFLLDVPKGANMRFGDFNGDGKLDVVYTDPTRDVVTIYFVH